MRKKKNKILVIICIVVICLNNIAFSKYDTTKKLNGEASIAKPIIVIEKDENINQEFEMMNSFIYYNFTIKNYNDDYVNEVDCEYTITLENTEEKFPVRYYIYDYSNNGYMQLENGKSEVFKLAKNKKENRKYRISIGWNSISGELANATDMNLKIELVQSKEEKNES